LRNVTAAAEDLCVTHSAIVHQLKQLQEWMGVPLLRRGARGLELTEAGERYRVTVCEAFARMAAETQALRRGDDNRGVRLSSLPMFAVAWLLPRLPEFWALHPSIDVTLNYTAPSVKAFDNSDLWIGREDGGEVPVRGRAPLLDGAAVPVCSPDYLDRHGPILAPADLARHRLIHDEDRAGWRQWFQHYGLDVDAAETGVVHGDGNLTLAAVMAGEGVGLLRRALVRRQFRAHTLVQIFDAPIDAESSYFVAWDAKTPLRRSVLLFRDWLVQRAADPIEA
jgi:LysR family glycine cleavage system transcriptional activator